MPTIYVSKDLYDGLVRAGEDPAAFILRVAEAEFDRLLAHKRTEGVEAKEAT